MKKINFYGGHGYLALIGFLLTSFIYPNAFALDIDWSGQFRAENHWVRNYALDSDAGLRQDGGKQTAAGYYIPGGGASDANFQTLFLRLRPKLIVNDNIYIKSEWWLGDPIFGFFGGAAPYSLDQRQWYSNQSRGADISAQRFWAEFLSDVGTVQVGRAPLHWGLGIFWNNGDGLWDRYQSTGDTIRLVSKFGAFSFIPSITKYTSGNNISGACTVAAGGLCNTAQGGGGLSDYSLALKYENPDEDFEGGVNFIKRIAGAAQDPAVGYFVGTSTAGMNFNTWDLYGRKKFGIFTLAGEAPIITGELAGMEYKTWAIAVETAYKFSDSWETGLRFGRAPGQPNLQAFPANKFRAYYFNPNYKIAMIMFNYQLANFAGPNTLNNPTANANRLMSPYDNPITNASYATWGGSFSTDKWNFHTTFTIAKAIETAKQDQLFFNTWRRFYVPNTVSGSQGSFLGWETDWGVSFNWDETFQFGADLGLFFPGRFYKFSNTPAGNPTSSVIAGVLKAGVVF